MLSSRVKGLWVLNSGNMQEIQKGFYSLHDKIFGIISNMFGQPSLYGSIEQKKKELLLRAVKKCGAW